LKASGFFNKKSVGYLVQACDIHDNSTTIIYDFIYCNYKGLNKEFLCLEWYENINEIQKKKFQ